MILNRGKAGRKTIFTGEIIDIFQNNLNPAGMEPRSFGWDMRPKFRPKGFSKQCIFHSKMTGGLTTDFFRTTSP